MIILCIIKVIVEKNKKALNGEDSKDFELVFQHMV